MVAEGYIGPYSMIDRTNSQYLPTESVISDGNNNTCMPTEQAGMVFQAASSFLESAIKGQISVEVILRSTTDCASPAWTWFVESECSAHSYLECSGRTHSISNGPNVRCEITCKCFPTCDYFFVKYNRTPYIKDDSNEICELRLIHGDTEPTTQL